MARLGKAGPMAVLTGSLVGSALDNHPRNLSGKTHFHQGQHTRGLSLNGVSLYRAFQVPAGIIWRILRNAVAICVSPLVLSPIAHSFHEHN
jgi:hypothetical protein